MQMNGAIALDPIQGYQFLSLIAFTLIIQNKCSIRKILQVSNIWKHKTVDRHVLMPPFVFLLFITYFDYMALRFWRVYLIWIPVNFSLFLYESYHAFIWSPHSLLFVFYLNFILTFTLQQVTHKTQDFTSPF